MAASLLKPPHGGFGLFNWDYLSSTPRTHSQDPHPRAEAERVPPSTTPLTWDVRPCTIEEGTVVIANTGYRKGLSQKLGSGKPTRPAPPPGFSAFGILLFTGISKSRPPN